ncbi:MAG: helix-turn-helix transcriptional regulator [Saprospiraceae bacterium]|nr:helix-turn-helix transcriptional regulator [Saprospiraceae bacterium]
MNDVINDITTEYFQLLEAMKPSPTVEDYKRFESRIPLLEEISRIKNSAISVFDLYQKKHLFASYNFEDLLGKKAPNPITMEYFDSVIHPDDYIHLLKVGIKMLKYSLTLKKDARPHIKLLNEYRIFTGQNKWIRVIEQHRMLEVDAKGNLWLSISILDVSPDQNLNRPTISRVLNSQSGESFLINETISDPKSTLTKRESQILGMMDKGLLSKEISHQLNISVHTVNTHRQRILEKTHSSNSIEALNYAKNAGII